MWVILIPVMNSALGDNAKKWVRRHVGIMAEERGVKIYEVLNNDVPDGYSSSQNSQEDDNKEDRAKEGDVSGDETSSGVLWGLHPHNKVSWGEVHTCKKLFLY